MTMTVAIAQTHLDAWLAADLAISKRKSYAIGDRTLTAQDGPFVKDQISYWQGVVEALTAQAAGATNPGVKIATWSTRR